VWLPAWIVSVGVLVWYSRYYPSASGWSLWTWGSGVVGAFLGVVIGVQLARAMGWRLAWIWGAVVGLGGAAAFIALGAMLLPT